MYTKKFEEISRKDILDVGGKGASLGEMTKAQIPVPPGFVILTNAFTEFINSEIPVEVREEILAAFDKLGSERVAVRSSAVAEDSTNSSWAGQLESYLNVTRDQLIEKIRDCWNSIKSERALEYAGETGVSGDDLKVAVVIQKMVDSEASGIMFTKNPISGDANEMMIDAGFGLGELIVQGIVTPDNYLIIKDTLEISSIDRGFQETMLVYKNGVNQEIDTPNTDEPALSENQILELAKLGIIVEKYFGFPCDIEWAYEDGKFYIVQSRPITT